MPAATLDLRLPLEPASVGRARRAVAGLALPPPLDDNVRLLVSELVTNSVRHTRLGTEAWVRITVSVAPGAVRVEVADPGPGFQAPPEPDPQSGSGWGLVLVERIADRWGVERAGLSRVWFEIDPRPQDRPA